MGVVMKTEHILESHYRLIFNVATPSYEEAWLEGYEACQAERDDDTNPYAANSREHRYWSDGWWAQFYGEEPLFTLTGAVNSRAVAKSTISSDTKLKKETWTKRTLQIGCALFATIACYTLLDNIS